MLTFHFCGADGKMTVSEKITSGMVGQKVRLEFSSQWDHLRKTAVFMAGAVTRDVTDISEEVVIPAEVLSKSLERLYVGVYGVSEDGTVVIPTIRASGPIIAPGADPSGDVSTDPALPVWAQLQAQIDTLEEKQDSFQGVEGAVLYTAQELTDLQKAQARENIMAAEAGTVIPDYWQTHLTQKIAAIKELQRAGGKDCYSFAVIADYHRYGNIGKRSPALIKRVMDECGIKFCLCLGDIQSGGAWKTKDLELAEWEKIENEFAPIRDRTLMIPGNHDGAYGTADMNGDGVISGTTDYYIYNLTPDEMYDLVYRKVSLIPGVTFDESRNGYYVDDNAAKVRYILVNTHYSDGAVNENGTAVNNYMRKIRVGQSQMDMVIDALQSVPGEAWDVVVGMHIPLAEVADSGPSGDMTLLRDVLEAYHNKTTYTNSFGTEGAYDYVNVDVDFTGASGIVSGVFCGHVHTDGQNDDYSFPIITSMSDDTSTAKIGGAVVPGQAGTVTEQSFDVFTVNKRTGAIYATKIGHGANRTFGDSAETPDTPTTTYTNLADKTSEDWYSESHYLNDGVLTVQPSAYYSKTLFVSNFVPVVKNDILRWRGVDMETTAGGVPPCIACYDENKVWLRNIDLPTDKRGTVNGLPASVVADENGVYAYEILIRGDTNKQFVYENICDKIRYVRFCAHWADTEDGIIITVNEEITS